MTTYPHHHVFACGGGVVELPDARKLFGDYCKNGGLVLFVHRDVGDIMEFLQIDKTRPAYVEDMMGVWLRREPWYKECSNYEYFSQKNGVSSLATSSKDFSRFLMAMTGRFDALTHLAKKERSFFLALTAADVSRVMESLPSITVGVDAVELRVDMLQDPSGKPGLPGQDYVGHQLALLRGSIDLPIIFTIRSKSQGGQFPDHELDRAEGLYKLALRMCVDFLDLEMTTPEAFIRTISSQKGRTKIIASHHDPAGELSWNNGSWVPFFNKALRFGDVVKLIGYAKSQEDNADALRFKEWVKSAHNIPIIALNMGEDGKLSRIQNHFMTPVTHPLLPLAAAPGILSAAEIRHKKFFLFGKPISQSRSPAMHNSLFKATGLPHGYYLHETDDAKDAEKVIRAENFGGASVTIPLKLDIIPFLDEISADARLIGAVNTIVPDTTRKHKSGSGHYLIGDNTDWIGMTLVLSNAGAHNGAELDAPPKTPEDLSGGIPQRALDSGVVFGNGGTARAAIHALHSMGYSPLYLVGRSASRVRALSETFPSEYSIKVVTSVADVKKIDSVPVIAIGTVPADIPMEPNMEKTITELLNRKDTSKAKQEVGGTPSVGEKRRILLEMAYKPRQTDLVNLAEAAGWKTIPGLEVLAGQGYYQVSSVGQS
jgi:pentafunctional AROM polypeptide